MSRRANEAMELLKAALKLELPSFVLTSGNVNGDPTLQVAADATPAAGEEVAYIKIVQRSYSGFPTISLASAEDGRAHLVQMALETSAVANKSVWLDADLLRLNARLKDLNMEIELYLKANGAIPVEADITSANLKAVIRADVRHPNAGQ